MPSKIVRETREHIESARDLLIRILDHPCPIGDCNHCSTDLIKAKVDINQALHKAGIES